MQGSGSRVTLKGDQMNNRHVATNLSNVTWQAELLRFTAFTNSPIDVSQDIGQLSWWSDLVGTPSDAKVTRSAVGEYQEEGSFAGGRLILRVDPTRIDWVLTPTPNQQQENPEGYTVIGQFQELLDQFLPLMRRWLEVSSCFPVQRLAFGGVLAQPVGSLEEGYRLLLPYLPDVRLAPEGLSDFFYQINRPRMSQSVEGLQINRLCKWGVVLQQTLTLNFLGQVSTGQGQSYFACRLELDINTAPDFRGGFSKEQALIVLQELVSLTKEVAEKGDVK